ncbi:MAG: GGDEF and EAL domain-containing protein [Alphaproteobacteria bacterium]
MTKKKEIRAGLSEVLAASGDIVYDWDLVEDTIAWYGTVEKVLGPQGGGGLDTGDGFNRCVNPRDLPRRLKVLSDHFSGHEPFDCEYRLRTGDGGFCWVHDRGTAQFSESGYPTRMIGTLRTVEKRKQNEARLEYLANYHELTGLYNKPRLREGLEHALAYSTRYNSPSAYLVVGLDKLTLINDTFGYATADAVIIEAGQRLERTLRSSDIIGHVGGDRFGVILSRSSESVATAMADKILCALRMTPVDTPSGPLHVTVSIGIVTFPGISDSVHDIMTKAETALQEAKRQGRNCFVSYYMSDAQRNERRKNMRIAEKIRTALKQDRLVFAYQPIVEANSHKVEYYECLVRMIGEDGTIVPAAEFVPVVEQLGLIKLIDRHALEMTVSELARDPEVKLALNVSGLTVADQSWLRAFGALVRDKPSIATRLVIEITETAAMRDIEESARFVAAVRDLGCRVALDDFGAGYTSFRHLKSLTVDIVKIDGSFVHNVHENLDNQLFIRTLVGLAEGFGLETVAECVETAKDAELLAGKGVRYLQGYYFGRPSLERPWVAHEEGRAAAGAGSASGQGRRSVGVGAQ